MPRLKINDFCMALCLFHTMSKPINTHINKHTHTIIQVDPSKLNLPSSKTLLLELNGFLVGFCSLSPHVPTMHKQHRIPSIHTGTHTQHDPIYFLQPSLIKDFFCRIV